MTLTMVGRLHDHQKVGSAGPGAGSLWAFSIEARRSVTVKATLGSVMKAAGSTQRVTISGTTRQGRDEVSPHALAAAAAWLLITPTLFSSLSTWPFHLVNRLMWRKIAGGEYAAWGSLTSHTHKRSCSASAIRRSTSPGRSGMLAAAASASRNRKRCGSPSSLTTVRTSSSS